MGVETWAQESICQRLRFDLPDRIRISGMGGGQEGGNQANLAAQLYVGYKRSREEVKRAAPYDAIETQIYEIRVQLKALKGSTINPTPTQLEFELDTDILNLLGEVKGLLRGFVPVHPVVFGLSPGVTELKGFANGIWDWSILCTLTLRRFEGERFEQIEIDRWGRNPNDIPLPFPIDSLIVRSGLYRSTLGDLSTSSLDREVNLYVGDNATPF
jgi:hypothetical protein